MSALLVPIGILLPTVSGWLLLRLAEGKHGVLFGAERWLAGFVLGCTLLAFALFLAEVTGIGNFSLAGMLTVQAVLLLVLSALHFKNKSTYGPSPALPEDTAWKPWQKGLAAALIAWWLLKVCAGWILLAGPGFLDDTVKNWNLRGKAFYVQQELVLELVPGKGIGVGSYPPTVPLMKTWLSALYGSWNDVVANSIHMLWYTAAIGLLYFALRRTMRSTWAAIGTYMLASLPLYLIHGSSAYADLFLSVHIFLAVTWLYHALGAKDADRSSWLKLGGLAAGLLIFTKNEAVLLYLPPLLLLLGITLVISPWNKTTKRTALLAYALPILTVGLPWIGFKWLNNLTFGNAKSATGMLDIQWHEDVLETIVYNNFFMGSWLLLPALFVLALALQYRTAFKTRLVVCTAFVLAVLLGQLPLYVLTALYTEALNQTGYARGVLHLVPLVVLVTTACLHSRLSKEC